MTDFFRINMPYGMVKNSKGEWCFFNREYTYLGSIECGKIQDDSSFFCRYTDITDEFLESLAEEGSIERNTKGEISRIWFYNDATTPARSEISDNLWSIYMNKRKKLCKLKRLGS